ncbi:ferredoxin [Streptomyces sp. NBC_01264]|uniref:ferredoxin n=1 Tax=Streptomyces sp. NBC_01264 TaxID=2903804 RepID=UPI0022589ACB|nr:ferredoxin [Streptomyces sp. NBC_01264]MCX4778862.1 ferredoxin [Streptomyces sp. NBC_01264]
MAWDPVAELTDEERRSFERHAKRPERLWLNVPGPFWTGMTDNCWTGRLEAPDHVLYAADSAYCTEYVFRQPRDPLEESLADFGPGGCVADEEVAAGVREFRAYLEGGLAVDLRAYLFRLEEGRYPEAGERLPQL